MQGRNLVDFIEDIQKYKVIVSYNGKSFDMPLLRTRYILHDIPIPFEEYAHVDLLHLARRLWRDRLPDRGPLEGIAAGLRALGKRVEAAYVTGCDVPLLVPGFVRRHAN